MWDNYTVVSSDLYYFTRKKKQKSYKNNKIKIKLNEKTIRLRNTLKVLEIVTQYRIQLNACKGKMTDVCV